MHVSPARESARVLSVTVISNDNGNDNNNNNDDDDDVRITLQRYSLGSEKKKCVRHFVVVSCEFLVHVCVINIQVFRVPR
jgi:hypothetical protein